LNLKTDIACICKMRARAETSMIFERFVQ